MGNCRNGSPAAKFQTDEGKQDQDSNLIYSGSQSN